MSPLDKIFAALIAIPAAAVLVFVVGCYLAEAVRKVWGRQ